MELNILYAIQNLHNPTLDSIMVTIFNNIVGDKGQLWVYIGLILFLIPKTRKCGACVLISYIVSYFICDNWLKELIARPRPCAVDETVELLVKRSTSYSCPSVHSALAFTSAFTIFCFYKKPGIIALIFAACVAFSRLYFFVHYPTDVIFGGILGCIFAYIIYKLTKQIFVKY